MRAERGQIAGDVTIDEPYELWGSIGGIVRIVKGGKLYMRGSIYGAIKVEDGGRAHIFGNLTGDLTLTGDTKVIVSGHIGGNILNDGGRLYVESFATVRGKIKTKNEGETRIERGAKT